MSSKDAEDRDEGGDGVLRGRCRASFRDVGQLLGVANESCKMSLAWTLSAASASEIQPSARHHAQPFDISSRIYVAELLTLRELPYRLFRFLCSSRALTTVTPFVRGISKHGAHRRSFPPPRLSFRGAAKLISRLSAWWRQSVEIRVEWARARVCNALEPKSDKREETNTRLALHTLPPFPSPVQLAPQPTR